MRKILITIQISLMASLGYSQIDATKIDSLINDCKAKVDSIDSLVLYKTLLDWDGYRVGEESSINEWLTVLYFDSAGVLKKSKLTTYSAGWEGYYLRYFGENGAAIYSTYQLHSGMNSSYFAYRYLTEEGDLIHLDFIRKDEDNGGIIVEHITQNGGYDNLVMPKEDGENYDNVLNIDSLRREIKKLYNIDSLYMPPNYQLVRFAKPQLNDTVEIVNNGANLRKTASLKSSVVDRFGVGDKVVIKAIKGDWYRVKCVERPNASAYIHKFDLVSIERPANPLK